jgi:hypothetical protein
MDQQLGVSALIIAERRALNDDGHRRRLLLRMVAAHAPVQPIIAPSGGATCMFCREAIAVGALEYEMTVGSFTVVAGEKCYKSFLQQIVERSPCAPDEHLGAPI